MMIALAFAGTLIFVSIIIVLLVINEDIDHSERKMLKIQSYTYKQFFKKAIQKLHVDKTMPLDLEVRIKLHDDCMSIDFSLLNISKSRYYCEEFFIKDFYHSGIEARYLKKGYYVCLKSLFDFIRTIPIKNLCLIEGFKVDVENSNAALVAFVKHFTALMYINRDTLHSWCSEHLIIISNEMHLPYIKSIRLSLSDYRASSTSEESVDTTINVAEYIKHL